MKFCAEFYNTTVSGLYVSRLLLLIATPFMRSSRFRSTVTGVLWVTWQCRITNSCNTPTIGPDGTVYIALMGALLALDPATGAVKWQHNFDKPSYPSYVALSGMSSGAGTAPIIAVRLVPSHQAEGVLRVNGTLVAAGIQSVVRFGRM